MWQLGFLVILIFPFNLLFQIFLSAHYAGQDLVPKFRAGEPWKKVFGPVFLYLNSTSAGDDPFWLWEDAKIQVWCIKTLIFCLRMDYTLTRNNNNHMITRWWPKFKVGRIVSLHLRISRKWINGVLLAVGFWFLTGRYAFHFRKFPVRNFLILWQCLCWLEKWNALAFVGCFTIHILSNRNSEEPVVSVNLLDFYKEDIFVTWKLQLLSTSGCNIDVDKLSISKIYSR